jgi:mannose-6-phosphate isomerase-like protein (cupin superfamily)
MKEVAGKAEVKSFNKPDEVRTFPKGKLELVKIGGSMIGRAVFEPGWRWSTSVKPIAKTESCQAAHFQYHVSGTLHVVMDDGGQFDCKAGDVSLFPPGHDAWVIGNEPVVMVDFQGMVDYAKQSAGTK